MGDSADPQHIVMEDVECERYSTGMEPSINAESCESNNKTFTEEPTTGTPPIPTSPQPGSEVAQQSLCTDTEDLQPSPVKVDIPSSCLTNMDCPVCFSRYDIYRVPKELSCRHTFCAICLKLLIRNDGGSWLISCPICRASTAVFGGLVCTLQNQESLMSKLENPDMKAGVPGAAASPEMVVRLNSSDNCVADDESDGNLRMAAKRLVILFLMLLILLVIILQFVYTGIMKWVLGFILGVVVIITVLLCFNPNCKIRLPGSGAQQKDNCTMPTV